MAESLAVGNWLRQTKERGSLSFRRGIGHGSEESAGHIFYALSASFLFINMTNEFLLHHIGGQNELFLGEGEHPNDLLEGAA